MSNAAGIFDHGVVLASSRLILRPFRETDWPNLLRWHNDPEVLQLVEGDPIDGRTVEEVQALYRVVAANAFCFMIESGGRVIGDCWLQRMNLQRILRAHPGQDLRRIDIEIGEKDYWGRGLGVEAIQLLTRFGFETEQADLIFGLVADYNPRSLRAFEKAGFRIVSENPQPVGSKAKTLFDLALSREEYKVRVSAGH